MATDNLKQFVPELSNSSWSNDFLIRITDIFEKQDSQSIPSFVTVSFKSLIAIEQWSWETLSKNSQSWISIDNYVKFFRLLYSFNMKLISCPDGVQPDVKISLLIPSNIKWIDGILNQIGSSNDTYITLANLWIDTVSYTAHQLPDIVSSPTVAHLNSRLSRDFVMTDQYKIYLKQLCQSNLSKSIFTAKQLFYIKTCSFSLTVYLCSTSQDFTFTGEQIIKFFNEDFSKMIILHSYTIDSWSSELLSCIAQVIGFISSACWWDGQKPENIELIASPTDAKYELVNALIRLLSYQPFYQHISAQLYSSETVLIDTGLVLLFGIVETYDLGCFVSTQTNLTATLWSIAQASTYDRIGVGAYGFLAAILTDDQLKELKLTNTMCEFFFSIIESAWNHPTKKWKIIPIPYLLKGFLSLSSNDAIQTAISNANKIPLFIELSDQYPMAYDIIWTLTFNVTIAQQIKSNKSFTNKLVQIVAQTSDENIRKAVNGILWNLNLIREEYTKLDSDEEKKFDIMISYSHKDKQICKQLYEELTQVGYRVWIDFDQMFGNFIDAMVEAIEQSRVIIICMSEQYRRSNYCRAEAQYAFQKQLHMVPILLQKHYKPDGWLGFLLGTLLYVDFTKYEYSTALEMLIKELRLSDKHNKTPIKPATQTKLTNIDLPVHSSHVTNLPLKPIILPENVQDWNENHVYEWLSKNDLPQMARMLSGMDGIGLIYFYEYVIASEPQQAMLLLQKDSLRRVKEDLSLVELSRFRSLIEQKGTLISKSTNRSGRSRKPFANTGNPVCCNIA